MLCPIWAIHKILEWWEPRLIAPWFPILLFKSLTQENMQAES